MNKIVIEALRNLMKLSGMTFFPSYFPQADLPLKHQFIQPAYIPVKDNRAGRNGLPQR